VRLAEPKLLATFEADDFAASWPYIADDFRRIDESMDYEFYMQPRFVTHIDDGAIASLTEYYRRTLPAGGAVLDICSSWISHLPKDVQYGEVCGVGMNLRELEANKALTSFEARDLNTDPKLPYADGHFDAVINAVSVDYMTKPLELFAEMHRVLKPGGLAIMSFSNRCFPSKAVRCWLESDEMGRLAIVANYFRHSAAWDEIQALDIIPLKSDGMASIKQNAASAFMASFASMDPMWVVQARAKK
jgi:SAM-dependent methyltransferase